MIDAPRDVREMLHTTKYLHVILEVMNINQQNTMSFHQGMEPLDCQPSFSGSVASSIGQPPSGVIFYPILIYGKEGITMNGQTANYIH